MDALAQKRSLAWGARERQAAEAALAWWLPVPPVSRQGAADPPPDLWTDREIGLRLLRAVLSGDAGEVREAVAGGCSPCLSVGGESVLHCAVAVDARSPGAGTVDALLAAGAYPGPRDAFGRTPLHGAVLLDAQGAALALVRAGARPVPDGFGETPLEAALRLGRGPLAELLAPLEPCLPSRAA